MNRPDDRPTPELDRRLAELLTDAVADVEPADTLTALRSRTRRTSPRRWVLASGGAALAAAAVVTAIALAGGNPVAILDDRDPVGPGPTVEPTTPPSQAVPAYFVGDTPAGPRLYREFQQVVDPTPGLAGLELLESGPDDPDYRSLWPAGSFESVSGPEAGLVTVHLGDGAPAEPSALALQQVVYTVSAGLQEPVKVDLDNGDDLLEAISAAPQLDVLSRVNLSDPSEGESVDGDVLAFRGVANSFEANVLWELRQGEAVVDQGYVSAAGWMGERLFPFEGEIDVSSRDPGTYTLIVETDDPTGGTEGPGAFSDTRTIVIE